jgi:hypothetical protein
MKETTMSTPDPTAPLPGTDPTTRLELDDRPDQPATTEPRTEPETGTVTPGPRAVRMRTMVIGLVMLVVAGAVLIAQLTGVSIDPGTVVLTLMVAAGLLLIAGAARS